jgi:hypothetical protein
MGAVMNRLSFIKTLGVHAVLLAFVVGGCQFDERRPHFTFEPAPRAIANLNSSYDPKIAINASGAIGMLIVHGNGHQSRLSFLRSHDGGDNFSAPVAVSSADVSVSSHGENSPTLIYRPTEIYALWEQKNHDGVTELMLGRSLDFGHSFMSPVPVAGKKTAMSFTGFSSAAVADDGTVYVTWLDGRDQPDPPGTFALYLAKSSDRGGSFSAPKRIAFGACPCCRPQIATGDSNRVYIAWRKVFPGDIRDTVVSISDNGGQSFRDSKRISEDNWKINGCPHSGPAIGANQSTVFVAWYTEGGNTKPGVKTAWSTDGGKTFGSSYHVSENVLDANHPVLSVSSHGNAIIVFQGRRADKNGKWIPAQIWYSTIERNRIKSAIPIPGRQKPASYPALATGSADQLYVAWTETDSEQRRALLSRGRSF